MSEYTRQLSAIELIEYIAKDRRELSIDKIRWQRDDFQNICQEWLKHNIEDVNGTTTE